MTDEKRPITDAQRAALAAHSFAPNTSGNPNGRKKKPDWLPEAAEEAAAWMRLVVTGAADERALAAFAAAIEEAWMMGRNNDHGEPTTKKDVAALVTKHWKAVMLARVSDKADAVRLKAAIELRDMHYGRPTQALEMKDPGSDEDPALLALLAVSTERKQ